MAHFFAAVDPDPTRRELLRDAVIERLMELPDLVIGSSVMGDSFAVWGLLEGAPQGQASRSDAIGILLGESMPRGEARRLSAEEMLADWSANASPASLPVRDGFSVFLRLMHDSVVVQTDLLGLIPVYHTLCGATRMVSSSLWLLAAHPDFVRRVDPEGIVGLLLTNSIVGGTTVHRDVRRLAAGAVLVSGDAGWREIPHYRVPVSTEYHALPVPELTHLLHQVLDGAVSRHLDGVGQSVLLLSGGLDSRILAGMLSRQRHSITALTYGVATDQEARIAASVAQACGLPQRLETQVDLGQLEEGIRWDGLPCASGRGGGSPPLSIRGDRVVSGYLMDAIVGGSDVLWGYNRRTRASGFEPFLAQLNGWGFNAAGLDRLLRPEIFGGAVAAVTERIRQDYLAAGETDLERSWRTDLQYIQRFHVGRMLWRQTRSGWPSAPAVDQEVIAVAGGMPLSLLADRHLEIQILLRNFPALAQLPIDRNSYDSRAHDPRLRDLVAQEARSKLRSLGERVTLGRWTAPERRYYHRLFDLNGPGWQKVRRSLEPDRERAYQLFQREEFDRIVPPAGTTWTGDAIKGASGVKLLLAVQALLKGL